jgi:hypothetical protein
MFNLTSKIEESDQVYVLQFYLYRSIPKVTESYGSNTEDFSCF